MSNALDRTTLIRKLRSLMPEIQALYGVDRLALFGSYARQEETAGSDLDLLISFKDPPSLLRFIELEILLSETLGTKVDLVMKEALRPNIGRRILKEAVPV